MKQLLESIEMLSEMRVKRGRKKGSIRKRYRSSDDSYHAMIQRTQNWLIENHRAVSKALEKATGWVFSGLKASMGDTRNPKQIGAAMVDEPFHCNFGMMISQPMSDDETARRPKREDNEIARGNLWIYVSQNDDGSMYVSVEFGNIEPTEGEDGAQITNGGNNGEVEVAWTSGDFSPDKHMMPMLRKAFMELKSLLPEYSELEQGWDQSETERVFGSEAGYWNYRTGR